MYKPLHRQREDVLCSRLRVETLNKILYVDESNTSWEFPSRERNKIEGWLSRHLTPHIHSIYTHTRGCDSY